MTVKRSDGTTVPFLPIKESGDINSYWMSYEDFAALPEVFCQRNTEGRLSKAIKHLSKLLPEHCVVFVAKLTEKDELFGKKYPAGYLWRIDSNTRNLNWARGGSDCIPKDLLVIEYSFSSCERIRESYNTFDSPDSVERNQEKLYGILQGMYRYTPQNDKMIKGQILCALNKACHFYFPDTWNQQNIKTSELPGQVGAFLDEIKKFDEICTKTSHWDQALVCAALMALKKYGTDNDTLNEALGFINNRAAGSRRGKDWDGVTHIIHEWETGKRFPDKQTNWHRSNGLDCTVPFALYWIDKYVKDETGITCGNNYKTTAVKYKDQTVSSLNHLLGIS